MKNGKDLGVSVFMITYNQENYIAQAIESVLMQKTNFNFNLFIGEDCSTDRTREIFLKYREKYAEKIHLLLNERNNEALNKRTHLMHVLTAGRRYVALLEGDDYWTDPLKLQKQINILEEHPEYAICIHESLDIWDDGRSDLHNKLQPILYLQSKI